MCTDQLTRSAFVTLLCLGTLASAQAQVTPAAPQPKPGATAAPLRFGTPGAARYEDFAALPEATVVEGPGGKRTTVAEIKRARQATLAHAAAANQARPTTMVPAAPARRLLSGSGSRRFEVVRKVPGLSEILALDAISACNVWAEVPSLNLAPSNGCTQLVLEGRGFGAYPDVKLVGQFPRGWLRLDVAERRPDGSIKVVPPAVAPSGVPIQCSGIQGAAMPDARLVISNGQGAEVSAPVCVYPQFEKTLVAPIGPGQLHAAPTQPAAVVSVENGSLVVRRRVELHQVFAQEWAGGGSGPLSCFPPGQDTFDLPPLPADFSWSVAMYIGKAGNDVGDGDANGGPGYRRFAGEYKLDPNENTSPRTVKWGVWESFHDAPANGPEGDSKVCLSLYALEFYVSHPKGVALPPLN